MADSKITALTAISTVDPTADPLVIVDVSDTSMAASGTTKKITSNQILGSGGTATLASATITGDLTVDTSTLKVDSTNNRVGINTATPVAGVALHVCDNVFGASLSSGVRFGNSGNNYYFDQLIVTDGSSNPSYQLKFATHNLAKYFYGGGNNYWEWYANNTLGMTLNSTGLGVGVTPAGTGGCLQLKSGVTFPATQVASSDANTLDDYEEGTFTATLAGGTTNPTIPVTTTGKYTKTGRTVFVEIQFGNVSTLGASGTITITGLPFTSSASGSGQIGCLLVDAMATFTNSSLSVYVPASSTTLSLYTSTSNSSITAITHNAGTTKYLWTSITYHV